MGSGMAQWDQFGGLLGRHNPGDLGYRQHVAFFHQALAHQRQRLGLEMHFSASRGPTFGIGFFAHIDHVGAASFI